jgi:hypothetical protein
VGIFTVVNSIILEITMKKKAILQNLLVMSAAMLPLTTYAGSNTLYGDFRYSFNNIDTGADSTFSGENNASRIGLKGTLGEADGITAFYHLQVGANIDGAGDAFTQRFFFAGIKGDFGKLVYGRTSTPFKMAGLKVDPFYDTSAGAGLGGATYGLSGLTNGWTDNSLAFSTPKFGAFSANAGIYFDDSNADEHDANIGVAYAKDAFSAGIQYINIGSTGVIAKSSPDSSAIRVHAKYSKDAWTFAGSIESIDPAAGKKQQYIYLSTTYQATKKLKVAGSFGKVDDVSATANGDGVNLGLFYQLLKKTNIYLVYSNVSIDGGSDRDTLAIGVSHKFAFE